MIKRLLCILLTGISLFSSAHALPIETDPPFSLESPSYLLMEQETGQVILEHNADEKRPVASVTKLMTILLTLEALEAGDIALRDDVLCSAEAAGMGGSQALLDSGSTYKLEDLLRSTIIASANDSAVALSEHIAGSEQAFTEKMNARAKELGMENTFYANCTGLPDPSQHTTARDIAILSREMGNHPDFYKYSKVWMDTLTHPGGRTTDLTNTNRLIRFYKDCDGYKTGSTNEARYCISATAKKGDMRLIAIVLGAPASMTRFSEARKLLDHGFSSYNLLKVCSEDDALQMDVSVRRGGDDTVPVAAGKEFRLLVKKGEENTVSMKAALYESVDAPVHRGDIVGELRIFKGEEQVGTLPAVALHDVALPGYLESLIRILNAWR